MLAAGMGPSGRSNDGAIWKFLSVMTLKGSPFLGFVNLETKGAGSQGRKTSYVGSWLRRSSNSWKLQSRLPHRNQLIILKSLTPSNLSFSNVCLKIPDLAS
jgi:hypothetical protein